MENVLIGGAHFAVLAKVDDEQQVAKLIQAKGTQALCFKGPFDVQLATAPHMTQGRRAIDDGNSSRHAGSDCDPAGGKACPHGRAGHQRSGHPRRKSCHLFNMADGAPRALVGRVLQDCDTDIMILHVEWMAQAPADVARTFTEEKDMVLHAKPEIASNKRVVEETP